MSQYNQNCVTCSVGQQVKWFCVKKERFYMTQCKSAKIIKRYVCSYIFELKPMIFYLLRYTIVAARCSSKSQGYFLVDVREWNKLVPFPHSS